MRDFLGGVYLRKGGGMFVDKYLRAAVLLAADNIV